MTHFQYTVTAIPTYIFHMYGYYIAYMLVIEMGVAYVLQRFWPPCFTAFAQNLKFLVYAYVGLNLVSSGSSVEGLRKTLRCSADLI